MRRYRDSQGRECLWIHPTEIEALMEQNLAAAALSPTVEHPVTDLERLAEGFLRVILDQYAQLEESILGATEFPAGAPQKILLNARLTEAARDREVSEPGALGRWRATLAHEIAHVILHGCLFENDPEQPTLFSSAASLNTERVYRCSDGVASLVMRGKDWREVQANYGMAALLMPRSLFTSCQRIVKSELGLGGTALGGTPGALELVRRLSARFAVSRQAALIRLEVLGLVLPEGQNVLGGGLE